MEFCLIPANPLARDKLKFKVLCFDDRSDADEYQGRVIQFKNPPYARVLSTHARFAFEKAKHKAGVGNSHFCVPDTIECFIHLSDRDSDVGGEISFEQPSEVSDTDVSENKS